MRDISANVRDDLVRDTTQETLANIKAVYSDVNAFYLITFPSSSTTYCFDMRKALPDGSALADRALDALAQLQPHTDGVILTAGSRRATATVWPWRAM